MRDRDELVLAPEIEAEVTALLKDGQNVVAVKRIVESTGATIGEAIGWVDRRSRDDTPCPYCGVPLPTRKAMQCFKCGRDWHESAPL